MVTKASNPQQQSHNKPNSELSTKPKMNENNSLETSSPSTSCLEQGAQINEGRQFVGEEHDHNHHPNDQPNGWGSYGTIPHNNNGKPSVFRSNSGHRSSQGHLEGNVGQLDDTREQPETVVLRRGFVPRTPPERVAQRKSSMAQLQQWVNQRRGMASQEDINRSGENIITLVLFLFKYSDTVTWSYHRFHI